MVINKHTNVIVNRDGELVKVYPQRMLLPPVFQFCERNKDAIWADYYRHLKTRKDDPHIVSKSKRAGEYLVCSQLPEN